MAQYNLTVARVEEAGAPPVIVVLVPWDHFRHGMGPAEYSRAITSAKNIAVAVSLSPKEEWHCDTHSLHHWKRITATIPPEKLSWHTMTVTGGEDPAEEIKRFIAAGIR